MSELGRGTTSRIRRCRSKQRRRGGCGPHDDVEEPVGVEGLGGRFEGVFVNLRGALHLHLGLDGVKRVKARVGERASDEGFGVCGGSRFGSGPLRGYRVRGVEQ